MPDDLLSPKQSTHRITDSQTAVQLCLHFHGHFPGEPGLVWYGIVEFNVPLFGDGGELSISFSNGGPAT